MPRLKTDTRILGSNGTQVSEVILFKGSAKHQYPHISNVITLVHFVARKLSIKYLMVIVDIKHNNLARNRFAPPGNFADYLVAN